MVSGSARQIARSRSSGSSIMSEVCPNRPMLSRHLPASGGHGLSLSRVITKSQGIVFEYPLEGGHITRGGAKVTTETVLTMLVLGGFGGWYVGRWRAENARARFDRRKTWNARKNYRRNPSDSD